MKVSNEETYNDIQWYLGDNSAYEGLLERDCLIWFSTKQKMVNYQLFELRLLQGGRRKRLKSLSYMEELTCPDHELFPEYEGKGNEKRRRNRGSSMLLLERGYKD